MKWATKQKVLPEFKKVLNEESTRFGPKANNGPIVKIAILTIFSFFYI